MVANTIAISFLIGSLATSAVTINLENPIDDYHPFGIEKPQIEIPSAWGAFENPYYTMHSPRGTLDGSEHYDSLNLERRKNNLHQLFETYLSLGEVKKARDVLAVAVNEFPDEKRFSLANNIIAPPRFISSKESKTEGIRDTIQFLRKIGKDFEKKWIAVSKGELLHVSQSYKELVEIYKGSDAIVVQVL